MFREKIRSLDEGLRYYKKTVSTRLSEGIIGEYIEKIQNKFYRLEIGSYPYFNLVSKTGGVNIVVSSWNMTSIQPVVDDIVNMIKLKGGKSSIV